ncbi:MAG: protein TolR [Alphaproteobacteria bacterium]|jgi:biopolymer transport protein TolR|nr:protein TolR [Alphaproteobacteria bacterium]
MAFGLHRGQGPRRRAGRDFKAMSKINVTPFVDVMLVLLVVFMVTAPLLTVGVPVDLPKTRAGELRGHDEPLAVSVDAEGRVWLQETEVEPVQLVPRLMAIVGNKPDTRIFVRGDRSASYGQVLEVMSNIQEAGFRRVALVTRRLDGTSGTAGRRK